jgi:hypothetical protein
MEQEDMSTPNMEDIVERIKDVLSRDTHDTKVLDKNVAFALGINPAALSMKKNRNLLPYDELTMFCINNKVNTNCLFFVIGSMDMNYSKKDF